MTGNPKMQHDRAAISYYSLMELDMNASATLRKLKDLDALEARVKQTVNPSPKMLQAIAAEKAALLQGETREGEKK